MKKVESKVVQDFIGTINDKTIYNYDKNAKCKCMFNS